MPLIDIIIDEIDRNSAIGFDRFMELSLYHPEHGYYRGGDPLGADGDFTTAPEISQMFGEIVGAWLAHQAQSRNITAITELGPGRGTLMADILRVMKAAGVEPEIHLVEINRTFIEKQRALLGDAPDITITWHETVATLPQKPMLFVANEFFDALPVRRLKKIDNRWHEIHITHENGALKETTKPLNGNCEGDHALPDSNTAATDAVISPATGTIATALSEHIVRNDGAAIIIDYGHASPFGDSTQAISRHAPDDILTSPGKADLTAWVDFSAIAGAATAAGITASPPQPMGDFLREMGIRERAERLGRNADPATRRDIAAATERLTGPAHMGSVFKVMTLMPQT